MLPESQQADQKGCRPFHLALAVPNLQQTKDFYLNTQGAALAEPQPWIDRLFWTSAQLSSSGASSHEKVTNAVDKKQVPIHLGVILTDNGRGLLQT